MSQYNQPVQYFQLPSILQEALQHHKAPLLQHPPVTYPASAPHLCCRGHYQHHQHHQLLPSPESISTYVKQTGYVPISCAYKCLQIQQPYPVVIPYSYGCPTCKGICSVICPSHSGNSNTSHRLDLIILCFLNILYINHKFL